MEMEKGAGGGTFRVSLSLAHYFADERARCYMAADGARRVRWLARRVRRTFALPGRVALRCAGHLLPPAEPLSLLRPEDALEVIPANCKVVDVSRDASPPPPAPAPPPPPPPDEDGAPPSLQEVKRRALALVDTLACEPGGGGEWEGGPCVARRRRRVRRRRARDEPEPEPEPKPGPKYNEAEGAGAWQDAAAAVIRNEGGARVPRQVQALPPPLPPPLPLSARESCPLGADTILGEEATRDLLTTT